MHNKEGISSLFTHLWHGAVVHNYWDNHKSRYTFSVQVLCNFRSFKYDTYFYDMTLVQHKLITQTINHNNERLQDIAIYLIDLHDCVYCGARINN